MKAGLVHEAPGEGGVLAAGLLVCTGGGPRLLVCTGGGPKGRGGLGGYWIVLAGWLMFCEERGGKEMG